jgi:hypothetical protein
MKQKDISVIVIIAFISAVISFVVSSRVFVTPANRQQKVPVVDSISNTFTKPSSKYFNDKSIDPTQQVRISNNTNQNPFGAGTGQ